VDAIAKLDAPPAATAAPTGASDPVEAFLGALARKDFAAVERLLAPDVWMRALLPKRMREETTAAGAAALYRHWYGEAVESRFVEAEHHALEGIGRVYLRYRFAVRPDFAPDRWHLVEQAGFCRVKDGRISRIDVVCTGYHPTEAAIETPVVTPRAA
jgi:hypothetical protein